MKALLLRRFANLAEEKSPLEIADIPTPIPRENEVLVKIFACAVCHTELDEIEGRTPPPNLPVVPGHQIVGRIMETGRLVNRLSVGERVGIAWIYRACGRCEFCVRGEENLCPEFVATGRDVNGGYAECISVPADFAHTIPPGISDVEAAPLLCAGAIGYRSLRLSGLRNGQNLGLMGFGASAHLVLKMAREKYPKSRVFVFARGEGERRFALELGATWSGDTGEPSPEKLRCIIDTTPVWRTVVEALENLAPGGRLVINAIRKEETDKSSLLELDYPSHLWMEKEIKSVANVSRSDVAGFLELASQISVKPEVELFGLDDANKALLEIKDRKIRGAKVLWIEGELKPDFTRLR